MPLIHVFDSIDELGHLDELRRERAMNLSPQDADVLSPLL